MKNTLFNLTGRVAIITGASKGIGASMARGLAEFGARVVLSSRKQEAVDELAATFRADGLEAVGIACHVGDPDQLESLIKQTIDHYGRLDILVNNAATNPVFGPIQDTDSSAFDKIMEVNLKAPFLLSNLAFEHLKASGNGSIIHISSVEGKKPSDGLGLYSVSKAALLSLTQSQAKEWGRAGIRVNAICPGLIKTKFSAALWQNEAILAQVEKHLPSGRMALPDELAGLAVFLASDASSYCTGSIFTADGGHLIAG
ncbi:MAG: glucose 1-dehydrogenase [Saprospiraceae bacterium]|nr:glucose 1-dehydrogenase [Saprospiraceae bacterium]